MFHGYENIRVKFCEQRNCLKSVIIFNFCINCACFIKNMVVLQNYGKLIEATLKNNSIVDFTLPSAKDSFLKISYEKLACFNLENNGKEPVLPFAQSKQFQASIKSWRRLSAYDSDCKDIYEIDLDVVGSNFVFKPGDTIGIIPRNTEHEVNAIINYLDLEDVKSKQYSLSIEPNHKGKLPLHIPVKATIEYTLTYCVDLRGVIKKLFLLALSRHTNEESEKRVLEYLCSKEGSKVYSSEILNNCIGILDILSTFKSCKPPIQVLFEHLPRLLPRPYSIVNSPNVNLNIIKICFSVMDTGNQRKGLTTGWLEHLIQNEGLDLKMKDLNLNNDLSNSKIQIYLRQNINGFNLPSQNEAPIILIGPGTGVSPFIGFLEEREYLKDKLNIQFGQAMLFFGCRNPTLDYIYETELKRFLNKGVLSNLVTAFSRLDGCNTKYVQDALVENGEEVTKLIKEGAFVYVCGDIKVVASQVTEALKNCLITNDNMLELDAIKYISDMQQQKRYIVDVWN